MKVLPSTALTIIATITLTAPMDSEIAMANSVITINDSDAEVKAIKIRMKDIQNVLAALPKTVTSPGLGAQALEAQKAFEIAEEYFKVGNWKVAISEAQRFFDLTQKSDHRTWLRAQFILGRSLEETGRPKAATKTYLNYLATISTSDEHRPQELTDVFARLVRLATRNSQTPHAELSKFLSSLVAAKRPTDVSDQMKYFSGVASSNIGKSELASSWLEQASAEATSPDAKARSKYFKALIAIHRQEWQAASEALDGVIRIEGISPNTKDMAHLALARVLIKQNKPNLALKNYESINDVSDSYRDGNFEKIFLLIQQNRHDEALRSSQQWLSKYSDHKDAIQIKSLTNWLDLKSGNFDAAKYGIEKNQELLAAIRTELKTGFKGPTITKNDAERLDTLIRGHIATVQDLDDIRDMFIQLDSLSERLAELDGVERGLIFALARSDLGHFKPALANQLTQYDSLADETLQAGAKLIFIDRMRLGNLLTGLDRQKLDANEKRRAALFGKYEHLRRQMRRWATWAPTAQQLAKLAKSWERLDLIAGKIAATGMISDKDSDLYIINEQVTTARRDLLNTLRTLQTLRAENLVNQSELTDSITIFDSYQELIADDMALLSAYSQPNLSITDKLDDSDARAARVEWKSTAAALKFSMAELNKRAFQDVMAVITGLETSDRAKSQLLLDVNQLRSSLETYAGERMPSIISQIDYALGKRVGKQLKWAGDLEYLKYSESTNAQDAARRKHELEKQILSDDLRDYGQRRHK